MVDNHKKTCYLCFREAVPARSLTYKGKVYLFCSTAHKQVFKSEMGINFYLEVKS